MVNGLNRSCKNSGVRLFKILNNSLAFSFFVLSIQYVALGPRLKITQIIIMNILAESKRNELKYSLKIAFTFLLIIVRLPVPKLSIYACNSRKGDRSR